MTKRGQEERFPDREPVHFQEMTPPEGKVISRKVGARPITPILPTGREPVAEGVEAESLIEVTGAGIVEESSHPAPVPSKRINRGDDLSGLPAWQQAIEGRLSAAEAQVAALKSDNGVLKEQVEVQRHIIGVLKEQTEVQQHIIDRQQRTIENMQMLLLPGYGRGVSLVLKDEQKAILERLEAIPGNDQNARTLAEQELLQLAGQRATRPLVDRLKKFLKERRWGILLESGGVAAPVWHNQLLRLVHHKEDGQRVYVASFSVFPALQLAERADRRFSR